METFDLDRAKLRAKQIFKGSKQKNLYSIIVPITAHVGSVATIFCAWFMKSGSFQFNHVSWIDWTIALFMLFVIYSGIRLILKTIKSFGSFEVDRKSLTDLIATVKSEAESSIVNISGDLSWLADDYASIQAIREYKPELKMFIYYDRSRVPQEMLSLVKRLDNLGVKLIPYPHSISPQMRCMLIDSDILDSCHVYIYTKCSSIASQSRSEHRFKIQEFGPDSHIIINSINAFIQSVEFSNKDPIRIGICGVNNVGKTSISNEVRRILSNRFDVRLFTDAFRIAANDTSTEKNYSTLFLQLIDESILEREVCIYDRTTLDNFCFLCLRAGKDNNLYNVLAPSIAVSMKKFDLIVHVRKSDEDYSKKTKYVTGSERKLIGQMLDDFFRVYGIDKFDVVIDFKKFDQSSRMWAEVISKKVVEIYQRLRLAE